MGATPLVSLEEYLSTVYRPDCDFVDGVIEERHVGELNHSDVQSALVGYFRSRRALLGAWAFAELRVQVAPHHFRIPDVLVVLGAKPTGRYITEPPFLCVEVLSPEDRMPRVLERIDEYLTFGVPYVWVIDPESRRGWAYSADSIQEAKDGVLRTANPEIAVPLTEVFDGE
ncbi:MAG: Uma2 family endonuclease [Acidobacteria bacterium]|nr:Uma2 family endonuclease [Acidobacteriota bacterium]